MPKCYYAILSCNTMSKDGTVCLSKIELTVKSDEGMEFFPVTETLRYAEEKFKDECIDGRMQVCNAIEISEEEYNAFNEWRWSQDRGIVTIKS